MPRIPVKLVSWEEITEWSWGLAKVIEKSGYVPDVVIAIARGGYVPARLLCDFLGIENLLSIQSQHWTEAAKKGERAIIKFDYSVDLTEYRALLVDDIIDTGESVILAKEHISNSWRPKDLKIAALQWISSVAKIKPDFYYMEVKEWVWFQYPWTRLEDVTQFLKRIIESSYREEGRVSWTLEDLNKKFIEWYDIAVGGRYIAEAIEVLAKRGLLKAINGSYIYTATTM
ncbi:MAG: phosphoribosyltransferase [Ignisphaera sp.]|nr:phosphoribosyltransferase [Ignisphaera sp.]MCX8168483.1 phosphoribosyltransferase [Ignisphaera sp.]MDW8085077.1 phosphoribosyltransferase [Ignisphaera sp.]